LSSVFYSKIKVYNITGANDKHVLCAQLPSSTNIIEIGFLRPSLYSY